LEGMHRCIHLNRQCGCKRGQKIDLCKEVKHSVNTLNRYLLNHRDNLKKTLTNHAGSHMLLNIPFDSLLIFFIDINALRHALFWERSRVIKDGSRSYIGNDLFNIISFQPLDSES